MAGYHETKRRSGLFRRDREAEELFPIKEDLAEWLKRLLGIDITAHTFMEALEDGVALCALVDKIQEAAATANDSERGPLSLAPLKCHRNAPKGSFYARDNASKFLAFAREMGVVEAVLFASNGLVNREQPKEVVLTLLDFARKATKRGFLVDPPTLVTMEREIEAEEKKIEEEQPGSTLRKKLPDNGKDEVDTIVRKAAKSIGYGHPIEKISEGYYIVEPGGVKVFVRKLRAHVMVRVGGGWSTLENFLLKHVPSDVKLTNYGSLSSAKKSVGSGKHTAISEEPEQENTNPQCKGKESAPTLAPKARTSKTSKAPGLYKLPVPQPRHYSTPAATKLPPKLVNSPYLPTARKKSQQEQVGDKRNRKVSVPRKKKTEDSV